MFDPDHLRLLGKARHGHENLVFAGIEALDLRRRCADLDQFLRFTFTGAHDLEFGSPGLADHLDLAGATCQGDAGKHDGLLALYDHLLRHGIVPLQGNGQFVFSEGHSGENRGSGLLLHRTEPHNGPGRIGIDPHRAPRLLEPSINERQ